MHLERHGVDLAYVLLDLINAKRQDEVAIAILDLFFWVVVQRDPGVPSSLDSEVLRDSLGPEEAFFGEENSSDACLIEAAEQLVDLLLGVMLDRHEAQKDLVLLDLSQPLLSLFYSLALQVGLRIVERVDLAFWRRLGLLILSCLLDGIVHRREDDILVLLSDRLVAEANGLVLFVPLREDVLELTSHAVLDVLYLAAAPEVAALVQDHAGLASRERLSAPIGNLLSNCRQNVAIPSLPLHLVHFHELVVQEHQLVVLDLVELIQRLSISIFDGPVGHLDLVLSVDALIEAVVVLDASVGKLIVVVHVVSVDDDVPLGGFLALLDSLISTDVPELLDRAALPIALLAVADTTSQATETVLMRLCFLSQHVVEMESTPVLQPLNDLVVVDVIVLLLSFHGSASPLICYDVVDWDLLQREDLLQLLLAVGRRWVLCVHHGEAQGLERIDVVEVLRLLLEVVDLVLLHRELVVFHVDDLLLASLVKQRDLIDVLQILSNDAFLVNKRKYGQACHLSHDVFVWIDPCLYLVPKILEVVPIQLSVLEVVLFVELVRRLVLPVPLPIVSVGL